MDSSGSGTSPEDQLLTALCEDRLEEFERILLEHPGVDLQRQFDQMHLKTCLEVACEMPGRAGFVQALLRAGAPPNYLHIHSRPIHCAAREGNADALEALLLDKRTKVNAVDYQGCTALHHIARYASRMRPDGQFERCLELLLMRKDVDVNLMDRLGYTAVHLAVMVCKAVVEQFLRYHYDDLDLDKHGARGRTARECIMESYPELSEALPGVRETIPRLDGQGQLLAALERRQLGDFCACLRRCDDDGRPTVNPHYYYGPPYGATCLEMVCRDDLCEEFLRALLGAGADPNRQTVLHLAAELGNYRVMGALLEDRRTHVNMQDNEGQSVLHVLAAGHGATDRELLCLQRVLEHPRANVNLPDSQGRTPLRIALDGGHREFVQTMLQEAGRRLDLEGREALTSRYPDLAGLLPEPQEHPWDPAADLFHLLYNGNCEQFVSTCHAVLVDEDDGSHTLLQFATQQGLHSAVEKLLDLGADVNRTARGHEGRTPIALACESNNPQILELLLGKRPAVNCADIKGNTPLHHAAANRNLDVVVRLLRLGAHLQVRNSFGRPALDPKSLRHFLDSSLQDNEQFVDDDGYRMYFDYSLLVACRQQGHPADVEAGQCDAPTNEMTLLHYISCSRDHRPLIGHPVIRSFLHVKWYHVRHLFYLNLFATLIFVVLLNAYILSEVSSSQSSDHFKTPTAVFLTYLVARETLQFTLMPWAYVTNPENVLDVSLIALSFYLLLAPGWMDAAVVITILASWTELILLTGRHPVLSTNIEMLKKVCQNYFYFLLSYAFLIIAFAFSFYSILHRSNNRFFSNPWLSVVKSFVMMTGEFEAGNLLPEMSQLEQPCLWLFSLFVFMVSLVLLNLLTGLAVSDTEAIKSDAETLSLVARIKLVYELETLMLQLDRYKAFNCFRLCAGSLFPAREEGKRRVFVLPNKGPDVFFERNKTMKCKMDLEIIGNARSIIINRGKSEDMTILQQEFSKIQEAVHDNLCSWNKVVSDIQSQIEANRVFLEESQKRIEAKLAAGLDKLDQLEKRLARNAASDQGHDSVNNE